MVRELKQFAQRAQDQGFPVAADRIRVLSQDLRREGNLPETLGQDSPEGSAERVYTHPDFTFYPERKNIIVAVNNNTIHLGAVENKVFLALALRPNRIVTHDELKKEGWEGIYNNPDVTPGMIKSIIHVLRKKFEGNGLDRNLIATHLYLGFSLVDPSKTPKTVELDTQGQDVAEERVYQHASGGFVFWPERNKLVVRGEEINLRPQEFLLLRLLTQNPNIVLPDGFIREAIWGQKYTYRHRTRSIRQIVLQLRKKIESPESRKNGIPEVVVTVKGLGHMLRDPDRKTPLPDIT